MKWTQPLIALAAVTLLSSSAWALPIASGGAALNVVFDALATDGDLNIDAGTDYLSDLGDSYWNIAGSGGGSSTLIIELAGFKGSNRMGIFDRVNPNNKVELFAGSDSTGDKATISILGDGSVILQFLDIDTLTVSGGDTGIDFAGNAFGFYLDATVGNFNANAIFYSDTLLNADGFDHMGAYQCDGEQIQIPGYAAGPCTPDEYILAFEDFYNGGDRDFTDFVFLIESIIPVPEPAMPLLLGAGLLGMGLAWRKRRG